MTLLDPTLGAKLAEAHLTEAKARREAVKAVFETQAANDIAARMAEPLVAGFEDAGPYIEYKRGVTTAIQILQNAAQQFDQATAPLPVMPIFLGAGQVAVSAEDAKLLEEMKAKKAK